MKKLINVFADDALGRHDAVEISRLIGQKEFSAKEAAKAAIKRSQQVQQETNAVVVECFDDAIKHAEELTTGFFAGVPTFIKDNSEFKSLPTTHGSLAVNAQSEKEHGEYIKQFLSLGFNCLGKSSLPEFGLNATTEPSEKKTARNPWNTEYSSGASSSGAAILVASGAVPIAHANDGGGSIRIPAACCGLVGLKPTRGRHVNAKMVRSLPIKIVSEGVVSRTVRDTAFYHSECEKYFKNPKLPQIGLVTKPNKARLRIGVAIDSVTGYKTDDQTREITERTADLMADLGHSVELIPQSKIQVFDKVGDDIKLYLGLIAFALKHFGNQTMGAGFQKQLLEDYTLGLSHHFKKNIYKAPFMLNRLRRSSAIYSQMFTDFDVILTPVLGHTTAPIRHLSPQVEFDTLIERLTHYAAFTPLANVTGAPAIAIPAGISNEGLPLSIQLGADLGRETTLLELAYELEEARPWKQIGESAPLISDVCV